MLKHLRIEVEKAGFCESFGLSGTCTEADFEAKEVVLFREAAKPVRVPAELVNEKSVRQCQVRPLFTFSRVSFHQKTMMLHQLGMWRHQESVPIQSVTQKKPQRLEDEQLRLWSVVMTKTFPRHSVEYIDPQFFTSRLFEETENDELKLNLRKALKKALQAESTSKLFLPIHCPESPEHPLGHWTFLVIEKHVSAMNVHVIRYYETMDDLNEVCLSRANHILECMGLQPLERTNAMRQISDECSECVCYYMEGEMRHNGAEGWGAQGPFSQIYRAKLRDTLTKFARNLESHRLLWIEQEQLAETKQATLKAWINDKAGHTQTFQIEMDKIRAISKAAALLHAKTDMPLLELPEPDKPEKKAKPKAKAKAKVQDEEEEIMNEIQDLLQAKPGEEPSGGGGVSEPDPVEEASSGSKVAEPEPAQEPSGGGEEPEPVEEASGESKVEEPEPPEETSGVCDFPGSNLEEPSGESKVAEPEPAGEPSGELVEVKKKLMAPEVKKLVADIEEIDEAKKNLGRHEEILEAWQKSLSYDAKFSLVQSMFEGTPEWKEMGKYVQHIRKNQTIGMCAKCRWKSGCERCESGKSLNYLMRHQHVPPWFSALKIELLK